MSFVMFTKAGCPFCSLMKANLKKRDIPFEVVDLTDDELRAEFYEQTGNRTVPQLYLSRSGREFIFTEGVHLGGWQSVKPILNQLFGMLETA